MLTQVGKTHRVERATASAILADVVITWRRKNISQYFW